LRPLVLKSERFRAEREADWRRLERLLDRAEQGVDRLGDADLIEMPVLYRAALSSLSVARATSLDASLVAYLEGLCARAYFYVYGARAKPLERMGGFFARDWPSAVRGLWGETLVSAFVFVLGALTAFLLVNADPDWFYGFIGEGMAQGRDPTASTADLRRTLYDRPGDSEGLTAFAAFLFSHNSQVSLLSFALGFAFGVPTVLLIAYNGCAMGAFFALYASRGLGVELGGWLFIHGTTEIFAAVLSGAAGLRIARAVGFPGEASRVEAVSAAGRSAAVVMGGVVLMLFLAGGLEGFGRQLITSDLARYGIGGAMAALWLAYFYLPREPRRG
jgi:uncharacterized membrane protein SpoIIM required for sporulation